MQRTCLNDLAGWNDWANVKYDFQNSSGYEDGDHSELAPPAVDLILGLCKPAPVSQGHWHRQCLGVPAAGLSQRTRTNGAAVEPECNRACSSGGVDSQYVHGVDCVGETRFLEETGFPGSLKRGAG